MAWKIQYYTSESGKAPVEEFIDTLDVKHRVRVIRKLELLAEFGADLSLPHVKKVRGRIWELRCDGERIFYALFGKKEIVLLHGFTKKRQQIPKREIRTAEKRMLDFERRGNK